MVFESLHELALFYLRNLHPKLKVLFVHSAEHVNIYDLRLLNESCNGRKRFSAQGAVV